MASANLWPEQQGGEMIFSALSNLNKLQQVIKYNCWTSSALTLSVRKPETKYLPFSHLAFGGELVRILH